MNPFDLSNKVMVITGGTNGIGRGLATYFAKQHVTVAAIGSRPETAAKLQADLAAEGLTVHVSHTHTPHPPPPPLRPSAQSAGNNLDNEQ